MKLSGLGEGGVKVGNMAQEKIGWEFYPDAKWEQIFMLVIRK